jgi:hypothetical protein
VRREAARREEAAAHPAVATLVAEPVHTTYATAIHLLPAAVVAQVKPAAVVASLASVKKPASKPVVGYTGRAADHMAALADHHLEEWYISETGLSFADLARL